MKLLKKENSSEVVPIFYWFELFFYSLVFSLPETLLWKRQRLLRKVRILHGDRMRKFLFLALLLFPLTASAGNLFANSGYLVAASNEYWSAALASSIEPSSAMTAEGWFYFDAYDTSHEVVLFQSGDDAVTVKNWQIYFNANVINFDICGSHPCANGSTEKVATFAWTPSANTWYHIALTSDGAGNAKLFVGTASGGDVQIASTVTGMPTTITQTATDPFKIGGYTAALTAQITFDGSVQLDRVWTQAQSLATINADNCLNLGVTTNMGGQWTLNNVLTDNSGNANTLTAVNGAIVSSASTTIPCTVASSFQLWPFSLF